MRFHSPLAGELEGFLHFKRSLGYGYARAEFTLREFDRFLVKYAGQQGRRHLDGAILAWLASKPQRKAITVSADATVMRQFLRYLRRLPGGWRMREPRWPRLRTESRFMPYIFSKAEVRRLLELSAQLKRPPFRAPLYRALILLLYRTGLRLGEALRLRIREVDIHSAVLFIEPFKGRARWVPFHRSLSRELDTYLVARSALAPTGPDDPLFVSANKRKLLNKTASETLRSLLRKAGLKPDRGRSGPRPYDFRHTFAVHRLTRWYRRGVDLQARLPWLSAYMGHDDILGTERYLTATPELLGHAGNRFRGLYLGSEASPKGEP